LFYNLLLPLRWKEFLPSIDKLFIGSSGRSLW